MDVEPETTVRLYGWLATAYGIKRWPDTAAREELLTDKVHRWAHSNLRRGRWTLKPRSKDRDAWTLVVPSDAAVVAGRGVMEHRRDGLPSETSGVRASDDGAVKAYFEAAGLYKPSAGFRADARWRGELEAKTIGPKIAKLRRREQPELDERTALDERVIARPEVGEVLEPQAEPTISESDLIAICRVVPTMQAHMLLLLYKTKWDWDRVATELTEAGHRTRFGKPITGNVRQVYARLKDPENTLWREHPELDAGLLARLRNDEEEEPASAVDAGAPGPELVLSAAEQAEVDERLATARRQLEGWRRTDIATYVAVVCAGRGIAAGVAVQILADEHGIVLRSRDVSRLRSAVQDGTDEVGWRLLLRISQEGSESELVGALGAESG